MTKQQSPLDHQEHEFYTSNIMAMIILIFFLAYKSEYGNKNWVILCHQIDEFSG